MEISELLLFALLPGDKGTLEAQRNTRVASGEDVFA